MKIRNCAICGKQLPENSPWSRKYCPECSYAYARQRSRERNRERNRKKTPQPVPQRAPSKLDMKYCRCCKYSGVYSEDYLCQYILRTGTRRGCKPGVGCEKRVLVNE